MRFDPTQSVQFDLGRGVVSLRDSVNRVLIPADLLMDLCGNADPDRLRDFGQRLGTEAGQRVAERLGRAEAASIEDVVDQLGGDLALTGLGSLGLERWGRALVFTVDGCPLGEKGDVLLAAILEGALQRALSRSAKLVVLRREGDTVRLLVVNPTAAVKVEGWLKSGVHFAEALSRLQGGS